MGHPRPEGVRAYRHHGLMKFVNPNNGIVIEMPDDWRGDCWVPVEEPAPAAPKATPKASAAKKPAEKKTKK